MEIVNTKWRPNRKDKLNYEHIYGLDYLHSSGLKKKSLHDELLELIPLAWEIISDLYIYIRFCLFFTFYSIVPCRGKRSFSML